MVIKTISWEKNKIKIIDQTKLPNRLVYLYINNIKQLQQAIKLLKVRGAPALGAAAALGMYLAVRDSRAKSFKQFSRELEKAARYIGSSRPTARNLFWGIERTCAIALSNSSKTVSEIKNLIFKEAERIVKVDMATCRRIGSYGAALIKKNDSILTVCNAGILATIDYGTALGVIYRAAQLKKNIEVFACETRPLLQGARLTTWELKKNRVPVTLLCDNMAATLMKERRVDKIIAGADRIAANGDTANKIGTYSLAVLARYHRIPFYIAAPVSTFDLDIRDGQGIPIEQRRGYEVTTLFFKKPIAAKGVKVFNPAFDVTPHKLISAIITDRGVIRPPFSKNIKRIIKG